MEIYLLSKQALPLNYSTGPIAVSPILSGIFQQFLSLGVYRDTDICSLASGKKRAEGSMVPQHFLERKKNRLKTGKHATAAQKLP